MFMDTIVGDSGSCTGDSSPKRHKSTAHSRKRNKPLMEKRRRARINDALVQLKALVLESMQQDNTQYSKLEKADILEMTVSHVASLQKLQIPDGAGQTVSPISKYRVGFNECANEVIRYLGEYRDGTCSELRTRLLNHLAGCIETSNYVRRGTIGQCGRDTTNAVDNCVNPQQREAHRLIDITLQKQTRDTLVNSNDTFQMQRDSTKRQLRFHGNQLSAESSREPLYSRLQIPVTSQSERNQYSPLINRNQRDEGLKHGQMARIVDGIESGNVRVNANDNNTENIITNTEYRQNEFRGLRNRQTEANVGRGSLLNRHVNQVSTRDVYLNGPLPLFARSGKLNNNSRQDTDQIGCRPALSDGFNRQNKLSSHAAHATENVKAGEINKQSRQPGSFQTEMDSFAGFRVKNQNPMEFENENVWRPW